MSRAGVEALTYLLDLAFDGDEDHSLLANLGTVRAEDWAWKPDGGGRSIRQIAYHAGVAKFLYANHLFGDASMSYEGLMRAAPASRDAAEMALVLTWLREGHETMRAGMRVLGDDDLPRLSRSHWGEMRSIRLLIAGIIEHDVYHAGEINHIRALRQGTDKWPWQ